MIVLEFIHRDRPVSVVPFPDLAFTESGMDLVKSMIKRGLVRKPERYDRYEFHDAQFKNTRIK